MSSVLKWSAMKAGICSINVTTISTSNPTAMATALQVKELIARCDLRMVVLFAGQSSQRIDIRHPGQCHLPVILRCPVRYDKGHAHHRTARLRQAARRHEHLTRPRARTTCQRSPGPTSRSYEVDSPLPCPLVLRAGCVSTVSK